MAIKTTFKNLKMDAIDENFQSHVYNYFIY